ncbi:MAG: hypothetical protein RL701_1091 [Pseudomonadota bacterium]|jgi:hypothetical protein
MRWLALAWLGVALACADNPYVIGHVLPTEADGGSANSCADSTALLCSSFESEQLSDEWSDTVLENAGEIARTTARSHTGDAALHAQTHAMSSLAVVASTFEPLRAGTVYFRAYLYVPDALPTRAINIFFLGDTPDPDPFSGVDFNLEDGALEVYSPQANPNRQKGTLKIPRGQWFCVRADVVIADQRASIDVHIDDALALHATEIDTLPSGGIRLFRAGIDWSSAQDDFFEIFMDDIALDTAPVACLAP